MGADDAIWVLLLLMSSMKSRELLLSGAFTRLNLVGVSKHLLDFQVRVQPGSLKTEHLYLGSQEGRVLYFAVRLWMLRHLPPGLLSWKRASGALRWAHCWHKILAEARLPRWCLGLLEEVLMLLRFGSQQTKVCLLGLEAASAGPLCASPLWCSASCRSFASALGWLRAFWSRAQKLPEHQLCEGFKCFSWSSRKLCVSIFTSEWQIISQLCLGQEEMSFKTQFYEDTILFILLVFFKSSQKHSHCFSQPKI